MKLSLKPGRASRAEGFQQPCGDSQLVLTLYRIYIFCFQMCNRLPEIMKNGDAGIFPVYYSLNPKLKYRVGWSLCFKKNVKYDFVRPLIKKNAKYMYEQGM